MTPTVWMIANGNALVPAHARIGLLGSVGHDSERGVLP